MSQWIAPFCLFRTVSLVRAEGDAFGALGVLQRRRHSFLKHRVQLALSSDERVYLRAHVRQLFRRHTALRLSIPAAPVNALHLI